MKNGSAVIKAIYSAWLVWAWVEFVQAVAAGASIFSVPSFCLVAYSLIVVGLLVGNRLAWLASPLPALVVAGLGFPWFGLNVGTALGFDGYHDGPGIAVTLLVGAVLPGAALIALVLLWQQRRKVIGIFCNETVAI